MTPPSGEVRTLFSEAEISTRVDQIARDVADRIGADLLVVAILKGSFVFTADLIRALHRAGVRPQIDFMQLASYGMGTESSGQIEVIRDLTDPVEGRDVLLVDDILDSGRTLSFARDRLLRTGARRVQLCVLLDKQARRVSRSTQTSSASSVPTNSSSATVWTTPTSTGNCPSSASSKTPRGCESDGPTSVQGRNRSPSPSCGSP